MQPETDLSLVAKGLRKAKGFRALEERTGVTRQVFWRLQNGKTKRLVSGNRKRLLEFLNAVGR